MNDNKNRYRSRQIFKNKIIILMESKQYYNNDFVKKKKTTTNFVFTYVDTRIISGQ